MKLDNVLNEGKMFEECEYVAADAVTVIEELQTMLDDIALARDLIVNGGISEADKAVIAEIISEMEEALTDDDINVIAEAVDRQFRRYGDKFLRQYRCTTGPKKGRMVTSPEACGKRKDPRKVRQGKKSARMKKGQRIRLTKFTKRKTQSKRLTRMNNTLRGDN